MRNAVRRRPRAAPLLWKYCVFCPFLRKEVTERLNLTEMDVYQRNIMLQFMYEFIKTIIWLTPALFFHKRMRTYLVLAHGAASSAILFNVDHLMQHLDILISKAHSLYQKNERKIYFQSNKGGISGAGPRALICTCAGSRIDSRAQLTRVTFH